MKKDHIDTRTKNPGYKKGWTFGLPTETRKTGKNEGVQRLLLVLSLKKITNIPYILLQGQKWGKYWQEIPECIVHKIIISLALRLITLRKTGAFLFLPES